MNVELHLNPVCAKRLKQYIEYVKKDSVYMLTVCQGLSTSSHALIYLIFTT